MFRNKRGDRLKILAWQGDGFALYLRRLEKGTFRFPSSNDGQAAASISVTDLAMILGGIEMGRVKQRPRFRQPA